MEQNEIISKLNEIERELAILPAGYITKKTIKGRDYYYLRVLNNGRRTETYIRFEELKELEAQIRKRKELEQEYRELKKRVPIAKSYSAIKTEDKAEFRTSVITGDELRLRIESVRKLKKRHCIGGLRRYVFGDTYDKVFILYGLRRTGKTTLMRQILTELPDSEFEKAAFIQVNSSDTIEDIDKDLRHLEIKGYKYVFIDEVTLIENFIEQAALFSDIYASTGMKIVLSGTDSLGFIFSKSDQLYDRCFMLHTTFIPYREFEDVLGIKGIDEYIRYGGTMSPGGTHYNETPFASAKNTDEYINSAIAKNIQHSLKMYQYGGHFRQLLDLYERDELTNVINRVVENINHSFTCSVVEKTFKSHDISVTAANLLRDRNKPFDLKEHIDTDMVNAGIKNMLDILNKEEQSIEISDTHMRQIKEYLTLLDIVAQIDLRFLPAGERSTITVITQPGLRYAQAEAIVKNLLTDQKFGELSSAESKHILERLLSEIRGRMMEEIVLFETKMAKPDKEVFKLQFPVGEFDMVVVDNNNLTCEIYEVKYSKGKTENQLRHLKDAEKCEKTAFRYGDITGRYVIYRGETSIADGIKYLNVEEYLSGLGENR